MPESVPYLAYPTPRDEYVEPSGDPLRYLTSIGWLNVVIGPNNVGKSRFLRSLVPVLSEVTSYSNDFPHQLQADMDDLRIRVQQHLTERKTASPFGQLARWEVPQWERVVVPNWVTDCFPNLKLGDAQSAFHSPQARAEFRGLFDAPHSLRAQAQKCFHQHRELMDHPGPKERNETLKQHTVYVPVLRGLRIIGASDSDPYDKRTRDDYALRHQLFTGQTLFEEVRQSLLGTRAERAQVRSFESFMASLLGLHDLTLTPGKDGVFHVDTQATANGRWEADRPIHLIGDGVQALMVLTYRAFTATQPTAFFIEEPELHLHPGMQRRFLQEAHRLSEEKGHSWWFTTHSNHIIDLATEFDIAVFRASRRGLQTCIESVDRDMRELLDDLGARPSSVFLVNATLWVEGVTDRLYLRLFFRLLEAHIVHLLAEDESTDRWHPLREDLDYGFVEYGGINLQHYLHNGVGDEDGILASRLTPDSFVLVDDDDSARDSAKGRLHAQFEQALGERFAKTHGREVENMLPDSILADVMSQLDPKGKSPPTPYAPTGIEGTSNRIWQRLQSASNAAWGPNNQGKTYCVGRDEDKGGSISKRAFADAVVAVYRHNPEVHNWDGLPAETRAVVVKIYRFILSRCRPDAALPTEWVHQN